MVIAKHASTSAVAMVAAIVFAALAAVAPLMAAQDQLAGSEWRPIEIAGQSVPDTSGMFIRFEAAGKVAGHGGCNRMGGSYQIDQINLKIGPLAATRMACPPEIMAREAVFGDALETTRLYLRDGTKLTLKTAQGLTTMRLVQTDWD